MKKEIKTMTAIASLFSFLEKATVAVFMMLLEWSRIKRKKAEDQLANEKSDNMIKDEQHKIDMDAKEKTSDEVIDDFLDGPDDDSSKGGNVSGHDGEVSE